MLFLCYHFLLHNTGDTGECFKESDLHSKLIYDTFMAYFLIQSYKMTTAVNSSIIILCLNLGLIVENVPLSLKSQYCQMLYPTVYYLLPIK